MYKLILAIVIALGVLVPTSVNAKPTDTVQTVQVKKQVKKKHKRVKKKPVIVQAKHNPFIRCEDKDCSPKPVAPVYVSSASSEQTAAEFFREDRARMDKINTGPIKLTRDEKRMEVVKGCSWFTCSADNKVVMEAKAWEGKTAKKDRKELKNLFSGSNVPPIDPMRVPWCAAFANAILNRSGHETTNSLMARSFLHWGSKTKEPQDGDIVVVKRGRGNVFGHVGFFQGYEWFDGVQYVKVLGGNTDHAVQVGYFPVSSVLGYRTASV